MAEDRLQLDILAGMAEKWEDLTQAMLTITIGLIMRELGRDVVDVILDVNGLIDRYDLDRTYYTTPEGIKRMRVTLTLKGE